MTEINNKAIDIIVLTMNNEDIISRFLSNLYENTVNFNLIVIDNGSVDKTAEIIHSVTYMHDNITFVLNSENAGVIGGRNQGYQIQKKLTDRSRYMMFLDSDQFVQEGWMDNYLFMLDNGYDIVGYESWQMNKVLFPSKRNNSLTDWFSYVGCGGMAMNVEVPDKIGMFDTRYNPAYFEDPDFNFRAIDNGYIIGWNINSKIIHLPHQTLGNMKEKNEMFKNSYLLFQNKWKGRHAPKIYQEKLDIFS